MEETDESVPLRDDKPTHAFPIELSEKMWEQFLSSTTRKEKNTLATF